MILQLANTIQIMKEMKAKKAAVKKSAKSSKMPAVAETKTVDTNDAIDRSTNIDTVSTQLDLGMSPTNAVSNHSSPIRKGSTDSAPIPTPVIPSITAPIHKPDTPPKQQVPATVPKLPLNISSSALSSYTYPNSGNGSTDGNDKFAPTSSSRKGSGATPRVPSGRLTAQAQSYKANDGSTSLPVPGEIDFSLRSQQVILPRPVSSGSLLSNISQKKTRAQPSKYLLLMLICFTLIHFYFTYHNNHININLFLW